MPAPESTLSGLPSPRREGNTARRLGMAVVLLWAGVMGYYAWRQAGPDKPYSVTIEDFKALANDPRFIEGEETDALGVYFEDGGRRTKVGYSLSSRRKSDGGYVYHNKTYFQIAIMDNPQRMDVQSETHVSTDFRLRRVRFSLDASGVTMDIRGTVAPDGRSMDLSVDSGQGAQTQKLTLDEVPFIPDAGEIFQSLMKDGGALRPGRKINIPVFEPTTLSATTMVMKVEDFEEIPCGGEKTESTVKVSQEYLGQRTLTWISKDGRTCREESPQLKLVMLPETIEQAMLTGWEAGAPVDLTESLAIPLGGALEDVDAIHTLTLSLTGDAPLDSFELKRPNQDWQPPNLTLMRSKVPHTAAYTLPSTDETMKPYLGPAPFLQADDAQIKAKAREIVGDTADPLVAARAIYEWMWTEIEKEAVASLPDAKSVLTTMKGDCNEHAILTAALGRAAGIPTRILSGLVYLRGKFYYHAWNEMWLGRWMPLDTALGQLPANAGHIALVEGGIEKQATIMSVLGRLQIKLVKAERDKADDPD